MIPMANVGFNFSHCSFPSEFYHLQIFCFLSYIDQISYPIASIYTGFKQNDSISKLADVESSFFVNNKLRNLNVTAIIKKVLAAFMILSDILSGE